MDPSAHPYTWQEVIDGVPVIGFTKRSDDADPDDTLTKDVEEFKQRMAALATAQTSNTAVVDFANYRMTGMDNGRSVMCIVVWETPLGGM